MASGGEGAWTEAWKKSPGTQVQMARSADWETNKRDHKQKR